MATATKKQHRSIVRNPARPLKINGAASGGNRKRAAASSGKRKTKRNPVVTTTTVRRRKVRRNPSMNGLLGLMLAGLAGGFTLGFGELGLQQLAPQASQNAQIIIPALGAWAAFAMGGKVPVVGKYSKYFAGILALYTGYNLCRYRVAPLVKEANLQLPFGLQFFDNGAAPQTVIMQPQQLVAAQPQQMVGAQPAGDIGSFINDKNQIEYYVR